MTDQIDLNKCANVLKDSYIEKLEKQIQSLKDRINKIEKHLYLIKDIKETDVENLNSIDSFIFKSKLEKVEHAK